MHAEAKRKNKDIIIPIMMSSELFELFSLSWSKLIRILPSCMSLWQNTTGQSSCSILEELVWLIFFSNNGRQTYRSFNHLDSALKSTPFKNSLIKSGTFSLDSLVSQVFSHRSMVSHNHVGSLCNGTWKISIDCDFFAFLCFSKIWKLTVWTITLPKWFRQVCKNPVWNILRVTIWNRPAS